MQNLKLETVKAHPYHQYLGLEDFNSKEGTGSLTLKVSDKHINPAGVLHGGVVYSVLDVVSYVALLSKLTAKQEAATHDIHVSVMRPAKAGDTVSFVAQVEKLGKSLAFITSKAKVDGKTIATARITKSIIS